MGFSIAALKSHGSPLARRRADNGYLLRLVAALALGASLGGCSAAYYDRRDTIALGGGDSIAANEVAQMVDPWPAQSGNTAIAFNGQKIQSAIERYRTNKVIPPVNPTTSDVENAQQSAAAATIAAAQTPNSNNAPPPAPSSP